MKIHIVGLILVLVVIFSAAGIAFGCSCRTPAGMSDRALVESAETYAHDVFVGRVLKIVKARGRQGHSIGGYYAVFRVSEMRKGTKGTNRIRIFFTLQCCLCELSFDKGKEYLVYADGDDDTSLTASTCGRTREIHDSQVQIDREYLGAPNPPFLNKQL